MRIESKSIADLLPAGYNPRKQLKPEDKEYIKLKKSIEEYGLVDPLIWNKQTGNLVGGHQRLQVIQDMGYTKVQVSVVDLHPDVSKMAIRFGRWHHLVDYKPFKNQRLIRRDDIDIPQGINNYGMTIVNISQDKGG